MSPPLASARMATLTAVAAVGLGVAFVALRGGVCGDCAGGAPAGRAMMPSLLAAGSHGSEDAAPQTPALVAPDSKLLRPIAQVEEALFVKGSLRGTDHPSWGTARGEPVKPNRTLRDRFDYYLLALNEASLLELTALVKAHAERDLGPATAAEILAVWERYLRLQQHQFTLAANPLDPASMQAALQEHQQARQGILGMHWAQAFYGDEEKDLADSIAKALAGQPTRQDEGRQLFTPTAGTDPQAVHQQRVERFGAEAAQRLHALDEELAQWDQRLARARAEIDAMRRNAALSAPQREDAIARYLDVAYPDPTERLRASGLLGL